jgi:uncharacterized protein YceK
MIVSPARVALRRLRRPLALALLVSLSGCASVWDRVRENERSMSVASARTEAKRGQCAEALDSLDRAQARIDLGAYARESTIARARCYEKLGLDTLAYAHRRMIDDFYTQEPMAYPAADGSSVFRVTSLPEGGFERPPSWLAFPEPRYSRYAQRSKIVGRVVVAFELASNDSPRNIRVLEMPHPLLATWAAEAVSQARTRKKPADANLMPGGQYVVTFVFEWRWARQAPEEDLDS